MIDWKAVAKTKWAEHRFAIEGVKNIFSLTKKLNIVIQKQHMEIVENKNYIKDLEERLWRLQITAYDDDLRKMTFRKNKGGGGKYAKNEISVPNLAKIISVHENSIYTLRDRGYSVTDIIDWAIQRDKMFLVKRHAKVFEEYKSSINSKTPKLNMKAIP